MKKKVFCFRQCKDTTNFRIIQIIYYENAYYFVFSLILTFLYYKIRSYLAIETTPNKLYSYVFQPTLDLLDEAVMLDNLLIYLTTGIRLAELARE